MKKPNNFMLPLSVIFFTVQGFLFLPIQAQTWDLKQKLGSSDHQPGDNLGISVAISGSFMIAGAWWEEVEDIFIPDTTASGAAYVYQLQPNGTWMEIQKLVSPHREALGYFGFQVAMDGDYAMVGAFNEDHSNAFNCGRVYAYHRNANDHWVLDDSLKIEDPGNNDYFGVSVAMAGDYALIGADGHGYDEAGANQMNQAGAAYLFKRQANNRWIQIRKFVAPDRAPGDQFGKNLDIDDDGFVIGAFHKDQGIGEFQLGAAYAIYCDDANCDLEQVTSVDLEKLVAPDQNSFEHFAWDAAISGKWIVCGKSGESDQPGGNSGSNTGVAYFFHRENNQWVGKQKVYAPDFSAFAKFGRAIAMDGPVCVIGAGGESEDANGQHTVSGAGAAYIYELQSDNKWMPVEKVIGTGRGIGDLLGEDAVDVSGSRIVTGAWLADTIAGAEIIDGGAVYLFERDSPITAIEDFVTDNSITLLQNPSLDGSLLMRNTDGFNDFPVRLRIFSMDGSLVMEEDRVINHELRLDLSACNSGLYFVQVTRSGFRPQILKWIRL